MQRTTKSHTGHPIKMNSLEQTATRCSDELIEAFYSEILPSDFVTVAYPIIERHFAAIEEENSRLRVELKKAVHYGHCKDETATTFMNQVKKLQAELETLKDFMRKPT
jgi:hypothetical protein